VNVQVFGFHDCQDTRKALRFFAERRIAVHFVNLDERPASKGELRRFADRFGPAAVVDKEGKTYKAMGLRVALDSPQRLLERALTEPRLLRTPLVRNGGKVTIGHTPDDWQSWIDAEKKA
jgi:arsenate reductase-like glutaredoxin family protein